jgi:hypothetical protein
MSGSSSAYLNGHLANRDRPVLRRKDLDLSEIITLCSKPLEFEERVDLVKDYGEMYPEFKYFLIVAYFCKDAFKEIQSTGPIEFQPSKVQRGASTESLKSMWSEVTRLYDTFPSGPKIKRGIAQRLLTSLYKEDALIINQLLAGKFYLKELNDSVIKAAFPQSVPQDPKS